MTHKWGMNIKDHLFLNTMDQKNMCQTTDTIYVESGFVCMH